MTPLLVSAVHRRIDGATSRRHAATAGPRPGTRPTPQPADSRYSITWEHTGHPDGPQAVLRFCGIWCSQHDTADQATIEQIHHNARRTQEA